MDPIATTPSKASFHTSDAQGPRSVCVDRLQFYASGAHNYRIGVSRGGYYRERVNTDSGRMRQRLGKFRWQRC